MNAAIRKAAGREEPEEPEPETFEDVNPDELERQERRLRGAFVGAAKAAGATRPEAVYRLVDLAEVEYAEDGGPHNAAELIGKVRETTPELFDQEDPGSGMNALIRRAAGRTDETEEEQ
jgi:hypothetical protein